MAKTITVKISEEAHKVIRRYRIDGGLTTVRIIELALAKLAQEVEQPKSEEPSSSDLTADEQEFLACIQ